MKVAEKKVKSDKRFKREVIKKLEVSQIVYLLQSFGMRVNEAVSLTFSDLKGVVNDDELEYLISKSREKTKFRTIKFKEYVEYGEEYELLKSLVESFLKKYKSGLFSEVDKEVYYEQRLTKKKVDLKIEKFTKRLEKDLVDDKELKRRVRKFKKLEENRVGYVYSKQPKYIIDFTGFLELTK